MHPDRLLLYGSARPPTAARRRVIAKLGNGADKLRWLERLFQKDAVSRHEGHLSAPSPVMSDDGKIRIDPLACLPPFVLPARGLFLSLSVPAKKPVQNGNLTGGGRI
jgi:hypothetical protein